MLTFFGRGSAFSKMNNNAFFTDGSDLVLIDCAMSSFHRIVEEGLDKICGGKEIKRIIVIVTHTHSDHISGIAMLIHYAFYILHIPVVVAAPSEEVRADLRYCCERLDGCAAQAYSIVLASDPVIKWVKNVILTEHSPELAGRCFGYELMVNGTHIVYTGDTRTLAPYEPYITADTVLYSEISTYRSEVHLYLYDNLDRLIALTKQGTKVFLMHLDDEAQIQRAILYTDIRLAPLL